VEKEKKYYILLGGHLYNDAPLSIDSVCEIVSEMISVDGHTLDLIDVVQYVNWKTSVKTIVTFEESE
jgi:hypothetical protein